MIPKTSNIRAIGWSKRSVLLECDRCGSHTRVELLPYLTALADGTPLRCCSCGLEHVPEEPARSDTSRTVARGLPAVA